MNTINSVEEWSQQLALATTSDAVGYAMDRLVDAPEWNDWWIYRPEVLHQVAKAIDKIPPNLLEGVVSSYMLDVEEDTLANLVLVWEPLLYKLHPSTYDKFCRELNRRSTVRGLSHAITDQRRGFWLNILERHWNDDELDHPYVSWLNTRASCAMGDEDWIEWAIAALDYVDHTVREFRALPMQPGTPMLTAEHLLEAGMSLRMQIISTHMRNRESYLESAAAEAMDAMEVASKLAPATAWNLLEAQALALKVNLDFVLAEWFEGLHHEQNGLMYRHLLSIVQQHHAGFPLLAQYAKAGENADSWVMEELPMQDPPEMPELTLERLQEGFQKLMDRDKELQAANAHRVLPFEQLAPMKDAPWQLPQ